MPSDDAVPSRGSDDLAVRDLLRVLRRRFLVIVGVAALVSTAALTAALQADKQYTATAKLLFRDPGFDQRLFGSSILAPSQDPDREAATNVRLVSLETVSDRAASKLGRPELTPARIISKVAVTSEGRSNVVAVKATDPDPAFAAKLANAVAEQYIAFRRAADRSKITGALRLVKRQLDVLTPRQRAGADGRSVKQRVDQLQILASLQTGNAELVQPARVPNGPSSPRPLRNTFIALLVGLALGIAIAIAQDRLDRRLRHGSDAEAILERPILGTIPESRSLRGPGQRGLQLAGPEAEAFRTLRTNLHFFGVDQQVKSILVTSSTPGDGKSTIAKYMASTAAASGGRTVLLEADLRRPTLRRSIPELHGKGLTDVLAGDVEILDVVQHVSLSDGTAPQGVRALDIIVSGPIPPNPTDLLESDRMRDVLSELEAEYDLVIVDSTPLAVVPDGVPLAKLTSGVVIVIREGKSTSTAAWALRKQMDNLDIHPMGVIVNGAARRKEGGYYGYYGYNPISDAGDGTPTNTVIPPGRGSLRRRIKTGAP